uniref:Uncharacterized protein n=1 Tax=Spumella elongata TaxID=89044 RepID=A0A7S3LXT0_9STRA
MVVHNTVTRYPIEAKKYILCLIPCCIPCFCLESGELWDRSFIMNSKGCFDGYERSGQSAVDEMTRNGYVKVTSRQVCRCGKYATSYGGYWCGSPSFDRCEKDVYKRVAGAAIAPKPVQVAPMEVMHTLNPIQQKSLAALAAPPQTPVSNQVFTQKEQGPDGKTIVKTFLNGMLISETVV